MSSRLCTGDRCKLAVDKFLTTDLSLFSVHDFFSKSFGSPSLAICFEERESSRTSDDVEVQGSSRSFVTYEGVFLSGAQLHAVSGFRSIKCSQGNPENSVLLTKPSNRMVKRKPDTA